MTLTLSFVCLCVRRFRWFGLGQFGQVGGEGEVTSLGEAEARDDLREIIRDLKQRAADLSALKPKAHPKVKLEALSPPAASAAASSSSSSSSSSARAERPTASGWALTVGGERFLAGEAVSVKSALSGATFLGQIVSFDPALTSKNEAHEQSPETGEVLCRFVDGTHAVVPLKHLASGRLTMRHDEFPIPGAKLGRLGFGLGGNQPEPKAKATAEDAVASEDA